MKVIFDICSYLPANCSYMVIDVRVLIMLCIRCPFPSWLSISHTVRGLIKVLSLNEVICISFFLGGGSYQFLLKYINISKSSLSLIFLRIMLTLIIKLGTNKIFENLKIGHVAVRFRAQ